MLSDIIQKIKYSPKEPGVYIFFHKKEVLYVGKASNLRNRLKNYLKITDIKTKSLHEEATSLKTVALRSNIEALIVESKLIKELKPKYNVLFKDDKNYFYVAISKEAFPRIFITHQLHDKNQEYIGPFTDGAPLKSILRLIRRTIPYCAHKPHLRICLDAQINNCPWYCCRKYNANDADSTLTPQIKEIRKYQKNIKRIKDILTGENKKFLRSLKDPYELLVLEKIWAHKPYLESGIKNLESSRNKNVLSDSSYQILDSIRSIECYDNSHLSGKEAVGAMTRWQRAESGIRYHVSNEWTADKNMWRKFKHTNSAHFAEAPRNTDAPTQIIEDDPRMMEEMVSRRLNHPEWPYPDLLIIDGGITQFNAAKRALSKLPITNYQLPKIISFAKPNQEVYGLKPLPVPITELPEDFQKIIRMAIQNTHNFVLRYHRSVRRKKFLPPQY